ncbi:hypothetical protein [Serratia quinivorans]|uniref:hypothetical protein n=1 Tax=Serratia quinivorans TaxID=137545 RepID=UPI002E7850D7|nr:hypothetical protein [Serratia quinivorans]
MNLGFGNNVKSALAADITATQTVISVMPGTGNLFAALLQPDPALENHSHPSKLYAKVTLTDAQETVFEICHLTAVSADKLTVIRGQEGTAAKGWSLNNTIANFATRGSEDNFVQIEDLQNGRYLAATAGGTANALTVDLPSTFYLNGGNTFALHAPLLITPTLTNTGTSTLMLTLSGHVVGTYPLVKGNNTALQAGDLVAKSPFMAIFNTEQNRFLVMNPTTEIGVVRSVNTHGPDASGNVKLTAADVDAWTKAQAMRQIRLPGNSATRWLKIAEMTSQANGEARLEIMLSGMADYGALAQGMAVDQVFMTTRSANTAQRVTAATVGNFIQQTSLSRTANSNEYVVGLTEDVNGSGVTTRYDFWLRLDGFAGVSSTMSLLNNTYTNVTVISDFTGANISTTAPAGIVYGKRARFYTTETKPTAADINAADVRNNFAAKMGIARVITGTNKPTSPGVWSVENSTWTPYPYGTLYVTTNNADLSVTPGDNKFIHYLFIAHGAANKFYVATEVNGSFVGWESYLSKKGGTLTGPLDVGGKISLSDGLELGNKKKPSPAYIDFHTDGAATDYNARIISPQGTTELNLIAADSANNGSGIIRLLGSKGDQLSFTLQGTAHRGLAWRKWGSDDRPTVLELDVDGGIWLINVDHTKDDKASLGVNGVVSCEGVNVGNARMAADGNIWGTRWNPSGGWLWDAIMAQIQNVGDMSVNGDQWWARLNLNGGTLIVQGGFVNGQVSDDGVIERVPLNISVPNRLLGVWTIIRNFAQGYETTWNPQVQDLSGARDAFNWLHGTKERMIYWIAVGH